MICMTDEEKRDMARKMIWHMDVAKLNYGDWLNIGFIMHRIGFEVSEWREWSRKDERFIEGECEKLWRHHFRTEGRRYGLPTLIKMYEAYCAGEDTE